MLKRKTQTCTSRWNQIVDWLTNFGPHWESNTTRGLSKSNHWSSLTMDLFSAVTQWTEPLRYHDTLQTNCHEQLLLLQRQETLQTVLKGTSLLKHLHTQTPSTHTVLLVVFMGKFQNTYEYFSLHLHVNIPCINTDTYLHSHAQTHVNTHPHVTHTHSYIEENMSVLFSCNRFMSEYFFLKR